MEVKAQLNNLRIAPRKTRLVANAVRGLLVSAAEAQLQFLNKRASLPILKLIRSAAANAEHNQKLSRDTLYIKSIQVDGGATLKRWKPRAQGRATPIAKRSSHVMIVLGTKKITDNDKPVAKANGKAKASTAAKAVTKTVKDKPVKKPEDKKTAEPVKAKASK